jgi:hypothetical protein
MLQRFTQILVQWYTIQVALILCDMYKTVFDGVSLKPKIRWWIAD